MSDAPQHEPPWVDSAISRLLRTGVIVSMVVVLTGLVVSFVRHPQYIGSAGELGRLTDSHAVHPHSLAAVAGLIRDGRGQGIVMLGLLLLVATPVARVAFSSSRSPSSATGSTWRSPPPSSRCSSCRSRSEPQDERG